MPGLCRDCFATDTVQADPRHGDAGDNKLGQGDVEHSGVGDRDGAPGTCDRDGSRSGSGHCQACGSVRVVTHPRLFELSIAHLDCDAFFAAIEKRDDPSLRHRPVIVGGGERGVVATCCYTARLFGVRSAMPMFKALKACPDAVVIRPDLARYAAEARRIRDLMAALTPLVEPVSIDEAYLDLGGTEALHGAPPAGLLARLAHSIETEVGITVSIGLSANKFLAKTASELDKPRGFAVIGPDEAAALLADRPVGALHGVGPKLAARLTGDGFTRVADLQAAATRTLVSRYGETGLYLANRAHGLDDRPVQPGRARKSVSSETTFRSDIADPAMLEDRLWQVCETTAARAKAASVEGSVVTLKLKTTAFRSLTRQTRLARPSQLAQVLFRAARPMLAKETARGQAYRLIGIGLSALSPARGDDHDLLDPGIGKRAAAERAGDRARARFGDDAVQTGRTLRMARPRGRETDTQ